MALHPAQRRDDRFRRTLPLDLAGDEQHAGERPAPCEHWQTSFHAAPVGDETTAIDPGRTGNGRLRSDANRPSAASFALSCSNRIARSPTPLGWIESTYSWSAPCAS